VFAGALVTATVEAEICADDPPVFVAVIFTAMCLPASFSLTVYVGPVAAGTTGEHVDGIVVLATLIVVVHTTQVRNSPGEPVHLPSAELNFLPTTPAPVTRGELRFVGATTSGVVVAEAALT
jgi:hypothetical protein